MHFACGYLLATTIGDVLIESNDFERCQAKGKFVKLRHSSVYKIYEIYSGVVSGALLIWLCWHMLCINERVERDALYNLGVMLAQADQSDDDYRTALKSYSYLRTRCESFPVAWRFGPIRIRRKAFNAITVSVVTAGLAKLS